jgi:hypothetical protein
MVRVLSLAVLGLSLALPMVASAGNPVDSQTAEPVTVAAVSAPAPEAKPAETPKARSESKVRGLRTSEIDLRFYNPYSFPVQAIPVNFPVVTPFGF